MHFYFGTQEYAVFPDRDKPYWHTLDTLTCIEPFAQIAKKYTLHSLLFPHQVHGTAGVILDKKAPIPRSFTVDADWIITNKPGVGIGVLTADCVPLLLHDPVQKVIGAVHAGWRGATDGVIDIALKAMKSYFGTQACDLRVLIGPHAQRCCYGVDEPFYTGVSHKKFGRHAFHTTHDRLYFDLYACCTEQLEAHGVSNTHVHHLNVCSICNNGYSSYRRDRLSAGRDIALIAL